MSESVAVDWPPVTGEVPREEGVSGEGSVTPPVVLTPNLFTSGCASSRFHTHVVGEGALARSYNDGDEEQLVLVDEASLDRLRCKIGTAHRQVTGRCRLQLPDRLRIEVSLDGS
jgi:hypothetical protein